MIGFFPSPYPDELLYSVCARYGETVGYANRTIIVAELFGSESAALVDLPMRLNHLLGTLPQHNFSLPYLVAEYTLFRFYSPFSLSRRIPVLLEGMGSSAGSSPRIRVGVANSGFKLPSTLRFCPQCALEDRRTYGETYWHRIHQLTAIDVCAVHGTILEDTEVTKNSWSGKRGFISADASVPIRESRTLNRGHAYYQIRMRLASDAKWLLEYDGDPLGLMTLRERYHNLLLQLGYAHHNGSVKVKYLLESFVSFYSDAFLATVNSRLCDGKRNWLSALLSRDVCRSIQHPIRHLLLINFLGQTAQKLFTAFAEYKPFGDGPWPCHNKAADHFGKPVITDCKILDSQQRIGLPYGIFSCECGYVYARHGSGSGGVYPRISILSYGPCWEGALGQIWSEPTVSLGDAASRLGVSALSVVRHALRLKLPINRPGARQVGDKTVKRYKYFRPHREEARRIHREGWVEVRRANPESSRKELIGIANTLYLWLRRFDSTWLELHLPAVRRSYVKPKKGRVNWESEDSLLSVAVEAVASRIRTLTPPVRVSVSGIIKEVGHRSWIESVRRRGKSGPFLKLPKTAAILSEHVESLVKFQIRKLAWATENYRRQRIQPTRYQLIRKAKIRNKTGRTPSVQRKLDAALADLYQGAAAFQA